MLSIADNLKNLKTEIKKVALRCGRDADNINLIAVSKSRPAEDIQKALTAGHRNFGENYVQEFKEKYQAFEMQCLQWHFIGHLQSNKAKDVLGRAYLIHTLDRLSLAHKIEAYCAQKHFLQRCLIQVKIAQEETKSGCAVSELFSFVAELKKMEHIDVLGLMAMASLTNDRDQIRREFRLLKSLWDQINAQKLYAHPLTELSMGMSADYELAIEEGATLLRIGTKIFGERPGSA